MMSRYEREDLARKLAKLSSEEIEEIRNSAIAARVAEAARRESLRMDVPVGTVCFYDGFDESAVLIRYNEDDVYPQYADPGAPSRPRWQVFTTYKTEPLDDWNVKQSKLSPPIGMAPEGWLNG